MAHRKANPKSPSLSVLGRWLGFWTALVEELSGLGGDDDTLRRVISDAAWRRRVAEFIVDAAKRVGEMFTVVVNPSDQRWREIDRSHYVYVDSDLTVDHFPVSGSAGEVTMTYVTFDHEPTTQEVLDEFQRRGLKRPDRAQTETFLDKHPEERQKYPVIGLCGSVAGRDGNRGVAFVRAYSNGVSLDWDGLGSGWGQDCRFLAVSTPR